MENINNLPVNQDSEETVDTNNSTTNEVEAANLTDNTPTDNLGGQLRAKVNPVNLTDDTPTVNSKKTKKNPNIADKTFHYPVEYNLKFQQIKKETMLKDNDLFCLLLDFYLSHKADAVDDNIWRNNILRNNNANLINDNNKLKTEIENLKNSLSAVNNGNNVIVRLSIEEKRLLDEVLRRLSDKKNIDINKSDYFRKLFLRYNIEQFTLWFHEFVISAKDVENITGISKNDWIKFLNK